MVPVIGAAHARNEKLGVAARHLCLIASLVSVVVVGCTDDGSLVGPGPTPGIDLTLRPSEATVEQGASVTILAIITRSGGFVGNTDLTAEGNPAGVTGTVGDVQTTGEVTTAAMTIMVDEFVPPGSYELTLRASGDGVADATASFALTVTVVPAYDLAFTQDEITIERGDTGTIDIALTRSNFSENIQLTAENVPAGVSAVFDPTPVAGEASSLTVTVDTTATLGEYTLTVRGVATGLADRTTTLTLSVTSEHKVAFRLDDIQARWCATTAADVIQLFVDKGVPLSIGVVGGDPWSSPRVDMAPDTPGGMLVNRFKNEPTIQLLSHSYSHTNLTMMTEQEQRQDFADQYRVFESFGITAAGLIPPDNTYDATTVILMQEFGMTTLSAQCTWSSGQPPSAISCNPNDHNPDQPVNGVTYIPVGAVLGENSWVDMNSPMSWDYAEDWATRQLNGQQFAVFMMHPQEFSSDGTCGVDAADNTKMATLSAILDQAKLTWSLLPFDEMRDYLISR